VTNAPPMIRITDLHKSFAGTTVLRGVDLEIAAGQVLVLIGASGSGKSTLLRCVNRLERPDSGTIELDGQLIGYRRDRRSSQDPGSQARLRELSPRAIDRQRADIGMVFQSFNLFPHMTVLANIIEAPIAVRRISRAEATTRARDLLCRVGLEGRESSYPRQMSGGQQQRVAIARSLAMRPKVMLLDEPTSALDPELVGEVLEVIRDLAKGGMTMIIATHEMDFAREVADCVAFLDEGRVLELGEPAQVLGAPVHPRTRRFIERVRKGDAITAFDRPWGAPAVISSGFDARDSL
jgi:polar amino acid transport system ATP-binding protein